MGKNFLKQYFILILASAVIIESVILISLLSTSKPTNQPISVYPNQEISLTGTVRPHQRPAADITYDFQLDFSTPIILEGESSGLSAPQNTLVLYSPDQNILSSLNQSLGKTVTVTGKISWGYAESQYLEVSSIK